MVDIFKYIEDKSYKIAEKIGLGESEDDIELYKYSIFMIFSETFSFLGGLIFSIIFNCVFPYLIINLVFALLRRGSGGFHCPTFKSCFWTSNIMFVFFSILSNVFVNDYFLLFLISFILGIYIMPICPKPSANSPTRGYKEDVRFRKKYRNYLFVFSLINIISIYLGLNIISTSISFSIISVVFIVSDFGEHFLKKILHLFKVV